MGEEEFKRHSVRMKEEDWEKFGEMFDSKSGSARRILKTWMEVVEDNDLNEEFEQVELAVLKTYKNAIEKNIQTLKVQRDKLQNRIDEIEEDPDGEVLFEVELKMNQYQL
jgi:hypothetical protein